MISSELIAIIIGFLTLGWYHRRSLRDLRTDLAAQHAALKADLTERIDEVKADLSGRIDEVKADLSGRIDEVRADLSGRIDEVKGDLSGRIDGVKADLSGRMDMLDDRLAAVGRGQHDIRERFSKLEGLVSGLQVAHDTLRDALAAVAGRDAA